MNARGSKAWRVAAALLLAAASGAAPAALILRGGGMVYDSAQDITWLQDWQAGGAAMNWATAQQWASDLVHGGYSDWRLPTTMQPDPTCSDHFDVGHGPQSFGTGCMGSEIGHLFYADLGGQAMESVFDTTGDTADELAAMGLFTNMAEGSYWSSTANLANPAGSWHFDLSLGRVWAAAKTTPLYAVAVRDGDVAATPVPEPQGLGLALTALGLALVARPRRRRVGPDQAPL